MKRRGFFGIIFGAIAGRSAGLSRYAEMLPLQREINRAGQRILQLVRDGCSPGPYRSRFVDNRIERIRWMEPPELPRFVGDV